MNRIFQQLFSGSQRTINVKKNIFWSLFIKGCSIVISLVLVPMTLGYVNSEMYGIWLTLSSIVVWFQFFDVGFTLGLKNKLTEAVALGDWSKGKSLVSTTYVVMLLIFIPLCIILWLINPIINWSRILNVGIEYNQEIKNVMYVLIGILCIQMVANVITTVVAAFQKVALSSAFTVIGNLISLFVIFILTKTCPPSLVALGATLSGMPVLVMLIASIYLYKKEYRHIAPEYKFFDKQYIKEIFGLGYKFFLIQIQIIVLYQSTNLLISNISGPEQVTAYNIAYKYLSTMMMIFNIIITPLWPAFTDAYIKKDFIWMKKVYNKMCRLSLLVSVAVIILIIISPFAYKLWIGDKASIPFAMTAMVGFYVMIHTWDSLQVQLINGIGAIKLETRVTIIGLIIHIPLALFIGHYIGAVGVVASMAIVNLIYATIFTVQIHKILNQKAAGIWIQ